jgi:F-type H+-transporting ATPase subunit b
MRRVHKFVSCCSAAAVLLVLFALADVGRAQEAGHPASAASHSEEADSGGPNPLAIDLDLAVWTGIVFLVLFGVLSKFAWPQIAAALDERERKIADNIAAAAAKLEEAKRILAEHEAKLAATAGEVRAMLEEARRDAEVTKGKIVAEARQAAGDERNRAVREIELAKNAAVQDLAVTSANLAIDLARKVVSDQLTPDHQARIVKEALGKLAVTNPSKN